ncbi:MAG: GtrA family protein [Alphaproteobacteria bacterium]|nr:GtrA family protein [Alphaproteobacteria bacterium]
MSRRVEIVALYALFATLATAANIASQWASLALYRGPLGLPLAMAFGTATGLAFKYVLDKRWIFRDPGTGVVLHAWKFTAYTAMGVLTTALFWATELAFDAASRGRLRFLGAAIGLAIGYTAKYRLDRRFVFRPAP